MFINKISKFCIYILAFICSIPVLLITSHAYIVGLDENFNGNGFATHNNAAGGNSYDNGYDSFIQDDGKIVVTGVSYNSSNNYDLVVWRYNPDGSLDTNFNGNGYVVMNNIAGGNNQDFGKGVTVSLDGKILVTGASYNSSNNLDMVICRFNYDGSLDTSFNGSGIVIHNNAAGGNSTDEGYDIQIAPDGKIVVTGYSVTTPLLDDTVIWRFNPNGTIDTSFNGTGYATLGLSLSDEAYKLLIQPDGKIVITGKTVNVAGHYDMLVARYNYNGTLDTSFNGTGYFIHNNAAGGNSSDQANSIILDENKYVITGYSRNSSGNRDIVIWRLNNDGSLDNSFNGTGFAVHNNAGGGNFDDWGFDLVKQNDKYLVCGYTSNISYYQELVIYRFDENGSLDLNFNDTGYLLFQDIAIQASDSWSISLKENKFIVSGSTYGYAPGFSNDMLLAQYKEIYQIDLGTNTELDVISSDELNIEIGTDNGLYNINSVVIKQDSMLIAEIEALFSEDLDWSMINAESNTELGKVFINNLLDAQGASNIYTLFIPKLPDSNHVLLCPDVASLEEITKECTGGILLSEDDPNVSIITYDGVTYWQINNTAVEGGMNITIQSELTQTGNSLNYIYILSIVLIKLYLNKMIKSIYNKNNILFFNATK